MIRHTFRALSIVLLAVFAFSSGAEATGRKTVRHRTRHSSRVVAGKSGTAKKPEQNVKPTSPPAEAAPAAGSSPEGRTSTKPR